MSGAKEHNIKIKDTTPARNKDRWIKFVRAVLYMISILGVVVGASLIKTGELSAAYADGTYAAKINNGEVIFLFFLVILCGNIMWGILRWFLRGYREKWKPGRVIGKLVGGGLWRMALIAPLVLLALLVIAPGISGVIAEHVAKERDAQAGISLSGPVDKLSYISEHIEEYSIEELEEILAPYLFKNIEFGVDASNNVSSRQTGGLLTQNVSAYSASVVTLDKAVLSSDDNFVIFYTSTGDDAITDERARELGEMLEEIIKNYKEFGFEYKYSRTYGDLYQLMRMQAVLEWSGIDKNILDTAMPVYVVNPYKNGSSTMASYAGRKFADFLNSILLRLGALIGEETARLYDSTPSYPFINILPEHVDSDSLAIITAHELGHHYISNYNYDNYGGDGSNDDFIDETTPNWMAINVTKDQSINNVINRNHYNNNYLNKSTGLKISDAALGFLGYPAVAFLENYYKNVPDAKTKIMDTVYHGDALNNLYKKAGKNDFKKAMISLAEKNLTGEYDGKLVNYTLPKGEELLCTDLCTKEYAINPAATEYLYFSTDEYHNAKITFKGNDDVSASVLGVGKGVNDTWQVIMPSSDAVEYKITDEIAMKYKVVAIAVVNAGVSEEKEYEIGIVATEFDGLIGKTGKFDFGGLYKDLGQGCFEVDLESLFDIYGQFMDLGGAILDAVGKINDTGEYSEAKKEWAKESTKSKADIEKAKQEVAKYRVSVCANYITEGRNFDMVKEVLQDELGWNMTLYDERDGTNRTSVFFGFDLLTRHGRIYVLAKESGDMGLVTINVMDK